MKDWRRINVSFTRAKRKLVIFGSRSTLRRDGVLKKFIELMEEKQWVYQLKAGADGLHPMRQSTPKAEKEVKREVKEEKPKGKVGGGVLRGRPFGLEVMAVSWPIRVV